MFPALDYSLLSTYLGLGPLNWLVVIVGAQLTRQQLNLLYKRKYDLKDGQGPLVSIVIPAKNEGEPIRRCLESALAQSYPSFEIVTVNDRSTDNTGAIIDELAAKNPDRLRAVHLTENPPAGWTGKCNALHHAVPQARGEWILFIDSDVTLEPNALRQTMAYCMQRDHQMVSLILHVTDRTLIDSLITPVAASAMFGLFAIPMSNRDSQPDNAFANGQFILIRRDAYDKVGGHEAVKSAFSEDVALARLVKKAGYRPRTTLGDRSAHVRMYSTFSTGMRGWSRNFFGMGAEKPWKLWAGLFFVIANFFAIYPALGWAIHRQSHPIAGHEYLATVWWSLVGLHALLMLAGLATIYGGSRSPRWLALLSPVSGGLLTIIFIRALILCSTRRVVWRGDAYQTHESGAAAPAQR